MFRASSQLLRVGAHPQRQHVPLTSQIARLFQPIYQPAKHSTNDAKNEGGSSPPTSAGRPPFSEVDPEAERKIAMKPIRTPPPELVSSTSTLTNAIPQTHTDAHQPDVVAGLKQELSGVKDAFALDTVPREAYVLGLAGTLPYLATSLSTLYLSWNLNHAWPGTGFFGYFVMKHESAQYYINLVEPVQLGYGAVIISFLGAIHWGMEWNERNSAADRTRTRYLIGAVAPAMAWPTLLLPVHWALTSQFLAFSGLYFVDARMAERGWAPRWYAPYRFVLTLVTGAAIFASLVGRAKIGEKSEGISSEGLKKRVLDMGPAAGGKERDWVKEEEEEREKIKMKRKEEEKVKATEERKAKNKGGKDDKKAKKGREEDEAANKEGGEDDQDDEKNNEDRKKERKEEQSDDENSNEKQDKRVKEDRDDGKSEDGSKTEAKQKSKELTEDQDGQKGNEDTAEEGQQPESKPAGKEDDNKSKTKTRGDNPESDDKPEKDKGSGASSPKKGEAKSDKRPPAKK